MITTAEVFALVEARRKELNLSQADVGLRAFGKSDGSAIQNMKRGSSPSIENLSALFDALGLGFSIGGPPKPLAIEHITVEGSDYARIPLHDARLSAGPGSENGDVAIIDHMAFRHDWLRKIDVKPENALIARISGNSMAPGIHDGDLVMIDQTRQDVPAFKKTRAPRQLPIFAFIQDDQARVKRLERRIKEKLLVLYSDNPSMPAEIIGEGDVHTLNILGQVVWSGHVWR